MIGDCEDASYEEKEHRSAEKVHHILDRPVVRKDGVFGGPVLGEGDGENNGGVGRNTSTIHRSIEGYILQEEGGPVGVVGGGCKVQDGKISCTIFDVRAGIDAKSKVVHFSCLQVVVAGTCKFFVSELLGAGGEGVLEGTEDIWIHLEVDSVGEELSYHDSKLVFDDCVWVVFVGEGVEQTGGGDHFLILELGRSY